MSLKYEGGGYYRKRRRLAADAACMGSAACTAKRHLVRGHAGLVINKLSTRDSSIIAPSPEYRETCTYTETRGINSARVPRLLTDPGRFCTRTMTPPGSISSAE